MSNQIKVIIGLNEKQSRTEIEYNTCTRIMLLMHKRNSLSKNVAKPASTHRTDLYALGDGRCDPGDAAGRAIVPGGGRPPWCHRRHLLGHARGADDVVSRHWGRSGLAECEAPVSMGLQRWLLFHH